jgi:hypothetical protein
LLQFQPSCLPSHHQKKEVLFSFFKNHFLEVICNNSVYIPVAIRRLEEGRKGRRK